MLRVAEQYAGTDTGRQRRANEDSLLARSPLFVVADGMGGAQAGEVASRIAVESFQPGVEGGSPSSSSLRSRTRERAHPRALARQRRPGRDGDDAHRRLRRRARGRDRARRRQPRLLPARRRAAAPDRRPLARRRADAPGPAHPRGGRRAPAALGHHARARPRGHGRGRHALGPARGGDVYLLCSDGLTTMVAEDEIAAVLRQTSGSATRRRRSSRPRTPRAGATTSRSCCCASRRCRPQRGRRRGTGDAHRRAGGASREPAAHDAELPPARMQPTGTPRAGAADRPRVPRRRAWTRTPPRAGAGAGGVLGVVAALALVLVLIGAAGYWRCSRSTSSAPTNAAWSRSTRASPTGCPATSPSTAASYVSGVSASTIPPERRRTLLDHSLRSEGDAAR